MPFSTFTRAARLVLGGLILLAPAMARSDTGQMPDPLVVSEFRPVDSAAVWAEPLATEPGRYARVELRPVHAQPWDATLDLQGAVVSEVVQPNTVIHLRLLDEAGQVHSAASMRLPLEVGANSFTFSILPHVLPAGRYEAQFRVIAGDFQFLAGAEMAVRKLDGRLLRRQIDEVAAQTASLHAHLDAHAASQRFPYEQMRISAVEQLLPASRRLMDGHDLMRVDETLRYMTATLDSVRATLTFGDATALKSLDAQRPDMRTVIPRDGAFYAGHQPVFLLGFAGGDSMVKDLGLLSRLGLNFALVTHGGVAEDAHGTAQRLGPVVEQAQRHNVALSVQLSTTPEANFPTGIDVVPALHTIWPEHGRLLPGEPHGFLTGSLAWLGNQPIVHSAGIANRPVLRFRGEEARLAFIDYLQQYYPSQYDLNRSWKMRLRAFNEVEITPDSDRIAYQHDWHRFSRAMGAAYTAARIEPLRAAAPSLPVYLKHDGKLLDADGTATLIDLERLGPHTPITGVSSRLAREHPRYAMDFPGHVLPYVLLRSLIPGRPLLDAEMHLELNTTDLDAPGTSEDFVHAGVWDAAIEGLNGAAVWAWTRDADAMEAAPGDLIEELGALEGLARASLDLNRLARIIVAFQQDAADVAILYSYDTLIRPDADDYRKSLMAAFEGVSFGGRKVRFVTEQQVADGVLDDIHVLVLPRVRAVPDETYNAVSNYIERGGIVIRTPNQIPYDGRGHSRPAVIVSTLQTVLVRGLDTPTAYFHAIESAYATGLLPEVPRPSNEFGYLLEGVKSRFVELDGEAYLYLVNLRQDPVPLDLNGPYSGGIDLIQGRSVTFPTVLHPLDPMLIRLGVADINRVVIAERTPAP